MYDVLLVVILCFFVFMVMSRIDFIKSTRISDESIKNLEKLAMASEGDVVFIRYNGCISNEIYEFLTDRFSSIQKETGVKIIILDKNTKSAEVEYNDKKAR